MPSASGKVTSTDGSQITCIFTIDHIERRFVGIIAPAVTSFMTTKATLTYDSISSLVGTKIYDGTLGIDGVEFTIGDDTEVSVSGTLISPIRPRENMNGVATWIASADE